jgi:hypothetical protein
MHSNWVGGRRLLQGYGLRVHQCGAERRMGDNRRAPTDRRRALKRQLVRMKDAPVEAQRREEMSSPGARLLR